MKGNYHSAKKQKLKNKDCSTKYS